jgi:hypothetical protein
LCLSSARRNSTRIEVSQILGLDLHAERYDYMRCADVSAQTVYMCLDANVGTFAVSLADVRPFADGVKIRLNLGNLSSVTFAGATLALKYARRADFTTLTLAHPDRKLL